MENTEFPGSICSPFEDSMKLSYAHNEPFSLNILTISCSGTADRRAYGTIKLH